MFLLKMQTHRDCWFEKGIWHCRLIYRSKLACLLKNVCCIPESFQTPTINKYHFLECFCSISIYLHRGKMQSNYLKTNTLQITMQVFIWECALSQVGVHENTECSMFEMDIKGHLSCVLTCMHVGQVLPSGTHHTNDNPHKLTTSPFQL